MPIRWKPNGVRHWNSQTLHLFSIFSISISITLLSALLFYIVTMIPVNKVVCKLFWETDDADCILTFSLGLSVPILRQFCRLRSTYVCFRWLWRFARQRFMAYSRVLGGVIVWRHVWRHSRWRVRPQWVRRRARRDVVPRRRHVVYRRQKAMSGRPQVRATPRQLPTLLPRK